MAASELIKEIDKIVCPRGWVGRKGKGHYVYRHPQGGMVVVSSSRAVGRARANALAEFKRQERAHGLLP